MSWLLAFSWDAEVCFPPRISIARPGRFTRKAHENNWGQRSRRRAFRQHTPIQPSPCIFVVQLSSERDAFLIPVSANVYMAAKWRRHLFSPPNPLSLVLKCQRYVANMSDSIWIPSNLCATEERCINNKTCARYFKAYRPKSSQVRLVLEVLDDRY